MATTIDTVRTRIQAQGFCGLEEQTYREINYPLRLAPAICMVWAAIGTALASATILWVLLPFAVLGALLPTHPFDLIYNFGLRYLLRLPHLPKYPVRRRFACFVASVMLAVTAGAFQAGLPLLGYIVGWSLVAAGFVNVSTGFCVPSFIYRMMFGKVSCS